MDTTPTISVFLQALGGKFLGPHAYCTDDIVVKLNYSAGEVTLKYQLIPNLTDDGQISPLFTAGSTSFMPILTMPDNVAENPDVNYLTADANTIVGTGNIVLPNAIEQARLSITIPTPMRTPLLLTQSVILSPWQSSYTIRVVVPGLLLTPGNTSPDTLSVFVNMMCGCKVTQGLATSYWTPSDFAVQANVLFKDGARQQFPMGFDAATNNSLFMTSIPNMAQVQSVQFSAQQLSTGNYGVLEQVF